VAFQVRLEATPRVDKPMPLPAPRAPVEAVDDEAMAALLLALPEDGGPTSGVHSVDTQGIPTGNTVMDRPVPAAVTEAEALAKSAAESKPAPPPASYDTAAAAKSLLQKYRQQSRK
jgi:hypothetical protein